MTEPEVHRAHATLRVSRELLEDSQFDIGAFLANPRGTRRQRNARRWRSFRVRLAERAYAVLSGRPVPEEPDYADYDD